MAERGARAYAYPSAAPDLNEVLEAREILGIPGIERQSMGQRGRGDPEIHDPGSGLPTGGFDRMCDRREGASHLCI